MKKTAFCMVAMLIISLYVIGQEQHPLVGQWDLEVSIDGKLSPSWLEVRKSGFETLVGRFVYAFGSARPVAEIKYNDGNFNFTIPKQWERGDGDMVFSGTVENGLLKGQLKYPDGNTYQWTGTRAPELKDIPNPKWSEPIELFNGKDLSGWKADRDNNQWTVKNGILTSPSSGANLISEQEFFDFKLHAEFRFPENGNSGIYLRGRYEAQIFDSQEKPINDLQFGAIYGFLPPNYNAANAPGEWQTMDITLIGRRITIVANGITILENQIIPGITGGALNSRESEPGPFMIQGDHEPVEFRSFVVTPVLK